MDSLTVLGLPSSHWHCLLSNFEWQHVRPPQLQDEITRFQDEAVARNAPHLILTGAAGIGKSHLGVGLYRWGVDQFGTQLSTWLNVPDFCNEVKAGYNSEYDPFSDFELAKRLVIFDDIFGRDLSPHEASNILYRLIDTAYRNNAAVVINMNQPVGELNQRLTGHEVSRILAAATAIHMSADKDYRRVMK